MEGGNQKFKVILVYLGYPKTSLPCKSTQLLALTDLGSSLLWWEKLLFQQLVERRLLRVRDECSAPNRASVFILLPPRLRENLGRRGRKNVRAREWGGAL